MPKNILHFSLLLFLIGGVCSFLVLGADQLTMPIIDKREEDQLNESLSALYDNIENYEVVKVASDFGDGVLQGLYELNLTDGETKYAYYATPVGKNASGIKMFVVYNNDGTVDKIQIIEHSETPNIGDVIATDEYQEQFVGVKAGENEVDTVTGATLSSTAVNTAVDLSGEDFVNGGYGS